MLVPTMRRSAARAAVILLATAAATAVIAGPASAHPALTISASPTTVTAGSTVTLTITGTSNGNYTNARIEVSAGSGTAGTTGTLTSFTSSPTCGSGIPSTPTCSEITNKYKLYPINLTNNQAFSYTITFTVDSATTAGTFKGNAQFYTSSNSTIGLTTGPTITVNPATSDLILTKGPVNRSGNQLNFNWTSANVGPVASTNPNVFSGSADPAGFASQVSSACTGGFVSGQSFSCGLNFVIPAGATNQPGNAFFNVNLLALGTYTVSISLIPANEANPADNTISWNCTVLTGLIITCT